MIDGLTTANSLLMEQQQHMRTAIKLARRAWGQTHPNPMVGCVIVRQEEILAEGWHERSGGPHAEVMALEQLGDAVTSDMSLYVTLEPCSTRGRTGACTDRVIASGIKNVYIGAQDPNPAHAGRGIEILRNAGLRVACASPRILAVR